MTQQELETMLKEAGVEDNTVLADKISESYGKDTEALSNKKNEILSEKKKLTEKMSTLQKQVDQVDIDEYNRLKKAEQKAELVGNGSSEEIANIQLELQKITTENRSLTDTLTKEQDIRNSLEGRMKTDKVKLSLTSAFTGVKILPSALNTLLSAYQSRAEVQTKEDGSLDVLMKADDGGILPVTTWIKSWAINPDNKIFIQAESNHGGGAGGSVENGTQDVKDMTIEQATKYAKDNGMGAYNNLQ